MNNKNDLRIMKTKKSIRSAFGKLLKDYSIQELTINQICTEAGISRITFYNHYQDKFDLFYNILIDEKEKLSNMFLEKAGGLSLALNLHKCIMIFIEQVVNECIKYRELILSVIHHDDNATIQYIAKDVLEKAFNEFGEKYHIEKFIKMPVAVACAYITGGVISLMHYFLTNINDYSKEDILKYCEKMINISLQNFI